MFFHVVTFSFVGSCSSAWRTCRSVSLLGAQQSLGARSRFCRLMRLCNNAWRFAGLYRGGHRPLQYPASKCFGSKMKPNSSKSLNTTSILCLQQRWPSFRHSVRRLGCSLCKGSELRFSLGVPFTWTSAWTLRTGLTELLLPSVSCVTRVIPLRTHSRHSNSSPRLLSPPVTHDSAALVTSNSVHFDAEVARWIRRWSTNSLPSFGARDFPL